MSNTPERNKALNRWGWLPVLGIVLPVAIALISGTLYVASIKANAETSAVSQGKDIESLKRAVEAIPQIEKDVASIKESAASTNQLVHDLAQYRFQFDPRQSDEKVKAQNTTAPLDANITSFLITPH